MAEVVGMEDVQEERHAPRVYIEIPAGQTGMIADLKVGETVKVTIYGEVKGLSQREDYEEKSKTRGNLDVEMRKISVEADKSSQFSQLLDEDD